MADYLQRFDVEHQQTRERCRGHASRKLHIAKSFAGFCRDFALDGAGGSLSLFAGRMAKEW